MTIRLQAAGALCAAGFLFASSGLVTSEVKADYSFYGRYTSPNKVNTKGNKEMKGGGVRGVKTGEKVKKGNGITPVLGGARLQF